MCVCVGGGGSVCVCVFGYALMITKVTFTFHFSFLISQLFFLLFAVSLTSLLCREHGLYMDTELQRLQPSPPASF